jgi:predicted nuclease of predicted toxin-antitoxin system
VSELLFHLDEDAESHALVRALRDRGVDVTTTSEARLNESADEALLVWATAENRVLLTYNAADFCRLHGELLHAGHHHAGIVILEQQRFSVGEVMRRILRLRAVVDREAMCDRLEFLSRC